MITEQQYSIVKQPTRELHCRVELLNYQFQIVDNISGVVLSESWTNSATSDIRRTGNLVIIPDDTEAYKIQAGSKIFLDKYVRVYIGIRDNNTQEIIYNNMGIYLINNPTHTFDSTTNQITLQLVDLMAKLTGMRNGNLDGYEYQIKEGQNVREIFEAVLAKVGFTDCIINIDNDDYQTIQYDMSVDGTSTLYDILSTINQNQYINYQMYFDVDGIFHFERIPMAFATAPVMVDDDIWQSTYIAHEVTTDYENLKNDIIVLGKTHQSDNYCNNFNITPIPMNYAEGRHDISLDCAGVKRERNHIKIAFTTPVRWDESDPDSTPNPFVVNDDNPAYLNLNGYGYYPLQTYNQHRGKDESFDIRPDTYYVAKLQNIQSCSIRLTGERQKSSSGASEYTYTFTQLPNDLPDFDGYFFAGYITKTATNINEVVQESNYVHGYWDENEQKGTLYAQRTLSNEQPIQNAIFYIYTPNTSDIYWQFMGEYQPRAEVKEENPNSPFYVEGSVGDIKITLAGGDYDNISTSELALERAKWELYTRCRLNDSLTLTCLPIYWLDVNWLVMITLPNETEAKPYIIKEISTSSGVTAQQQITLMTFYDYYNNEE